MKRRFLHQFLNIEYLFASLLVMAMVQILIVVSDNLPEADETSFLNPIFDRIDFLNIEDVSLDAIFAMKDTKFSDPRIFVINVGEVGPTPDGKIAMMLYKLSEYGVRVIGIDIFFDGLHFERFHPDRTWEIEAIKQAFKEVSNIVLVNGYDNVRLKPVIHIDPDVQNTVPHYGYANLSKDADEVVRRFWPYRTIGGESWLAFPVQILKLYDSSYISPLLRLPEKQQIIYFTGTYQQFQVVPIDDIAFGDMYRDLLKDAIVLVGFVNEGGLFYLDDTHKTPMGRKTVRYNIDGSASIGVEGPDMAGILIHANIINMLLNHEFIFPVPIWIDWLLVFLLSYISIAVYRLLRTKATSKAGVTVLIMTNLLSETIVVFFLPIIAFFFFDFKISYNLMATSVLLFIPASAATTKLRFWLLRIRTTMIFRSAATPIPVVLAESFADDEAFPANIRLLYAAQVLIHFAVAVETAKRAANRYALPYGIHLSWVETWAFLLPEIGWIFTSTKKKDRERQYFFTYLSGKKDQLLRESGMKNTLFSTQLKNFNEFFYFEEWELMLPHVIEMYKRFFARYHLTELNVATLMGESELEMKTISPSGEYFTKECISIEELSEGMYIRTTKNNKQLFRISPFCEYAECKVHRRKELFVYAGLVRKQVGMEPYPVYFGKTVICDPVLPLWTRSELAAMFPDDYSSIET